MGRATAPCAAAPLGPIARSCATLNITLWTQAASRHLAHLPGAVDTSTPFCDGAHSTAVNGAFAASAAAHAAAAALSVYSGSPRTSTQPAHSAHSPSVHGPFLRR